MRFTHWSRRQWRFMNDGTVPDKYVPQVDTLSNGEIPKAVQLPPRSRQLIRQRPVFTDRTSVPKWVFLTLKCLYSCLSLSAWAALTKFHGPGGLNNRKLFFHTFRVWTSEISMTYGQVVVTACFYAGRWPTLSLCPPVAGRATGGPLLKRTLILLWGPQPHDL